MPNAIPKAMNPQPPVDALAVPSAEDVLPGGTERLVRLVLGDDMANHLNRKYPGRINVYCDAVRFMISTLHAMGAVDGEQGLPVEFPEDLMGLRPVENRLLLEGLVASGRLVRVGVTGYRLSQPMFLAIDPGP
ncbi:MAG TPA: hypothetical protein VFQ07_13105 [Candidatus Polarisedimenticolia bacterium]|nr:hypothetical protein [Candidatus Polarisedimenticolia bacterium]